MLVQRGIGNTGQAQVLNDTQLLGKGQWLLRVHTLSVHAEVFEFNPWQS